MSSFTWTDLIDGVDEASADPINTIGRYIADSGLSGRNLLHNWDFRNPVNQRGASSYSGVYVYATDRWKINGLTYNVAAKTLAPEASGVADPKMYQPIELSRVTGTEIYTLSVIIDGILYSVTGVPDSGAYAATPFGSLSFGTDGATYYAQIGLPWGGSTITMTDSKFELGSVSTLANDPPADYGEQLILCKRFFRLWTTSDARTDALKEVGLMRTASPTPSTINIGGTDYYAASADL